MPKNLAVKLQLLRVDNFKYLPVNFHERFTHFTFPTVYITEGKYWNQLKKFRKFWDVLSSGSHETGSRAKKVTAFDSAKPGPHIHIFFLSQGSRVSVKMGTKSEKVCMCVWRFLLTSISPCISKVHGHFLLKFGMLPSLYGALMLLNFCGDWNDSCEKLVTNRNFSYWSRLSRNATHVRNELRFI